MYNSSRSLFSLLDADNPSFGNDDNEWRRRHSIFSLQCRQFFLVSRRRLEWCRAFFDGVANSIFSLRRPVTTIWVDDFTVGYHRRFIHLGSGEAHVGKVMVVLETVVPIVVVDGDGDGGGGGGCGSDDGDGWGCL
ncbi:Hypothetical predicted protein [Olea europaea subsp. europaea]|uniref:Uncharacterized protein n=1 Tax=Olea europaea subsp. europaea TaxID=158383 RepID=A0A8S0R7K6_OLEEU|nr:Hypothetical predicted protein [Olea europaea subsp. europaea]